MESNSISGNKIGSNQNLTRKSIQSHQNSTCPSQPPNTLKLSQIVLQCEEALPQSITLEKEINKEQKCVLCSCKGSNKFSCMHYICDLCFKDYCVEKVLRDIVPFCPQQNCTKFLTIGSTDFRELPAQIQKKYEIIFKNAEIAGRGSLADSPQIQENTFDKTQLQLQRDSHEKALKYRKCSKCNKTNKISNEQMRVNCECGNSFCYLCGRRSTGSHACKYLYKLKAQRKKQKRQKQNSLNNQNKGFKKFLVGLLWGPLFLFVLLPKAVLFFVILLIISIFAGISFYAVSYIIKLDKLYKKFFLVIFFPFAMILGVGMAWTTFFSIFVVEQIQFYESLKSCLISI